MDKCLVKHMAGQHGLLDLYGIDQVLACDQLRIAQYLTEAAQFAQATILQSHFHSFGTNKGVTGVLMLSESHISIHTWPEHRFAAVDIFMCGNHQITLALEHLKSVFVPNSLQWQLVDRGVLIASEIIENKA